MRICLDTEAVTAKADIEVEDATVASMAGGKLIAHKNGNVIDPSHLYIVGFWSLGGRQIVIDKITLE